MSTVNTKSLKSVLEAVPTGYLVDAAWLKSQGLAYATFRDYVKRGWLERLIRGVYRRPVPGGSPKTVDWKSCLLSAQHIMNYDVHVGGMTALTLQGYSHYVSPGGTTPVWVYGQKPPNWLTRLPMDARVVTRNTALFSEPSLGLDKEETNARNTLPWEWKLRMSAPERAVLEAMDELPDNESFDHLDLVFQSLTTLRPRMLSALLQSCKKVKVRRLFFVFADRHHHAWRKHVNPEDFDLGSGDRAMVKGGKIHPRYRIMVPPAFLRTEGNNES